MVGSTAVWQQPFQKDHRDLDIQRGESQVRAMVMLSLQLSQQGWLPWYPGTSLGGCLFMPLLTFLGELGGPRAGGGGGDQHQLSSVQRPQKPTQS